MPPRCHPPAVLAAILASCLAPAARAEPLDFLPNCDITYRMGQEEAEGEE